MGKMALRSKLGRKLNHDLRSQIGGREMIIESELQGLI